jgi:RecA-family ATPase
MDYPEGFHAWPLDLRNEFFAQAAATYSRERAAKGNGAAARFAPPTDGNSLERGGVSPPPQPVKLEFVAASTLGEHPRPRHFLVPDLIPGRNVTLLSGDGGTGKSLLALQLAVAVATRDSQWLGLEVAHGGAVFVSAEDELDEVHRRFTNICQAEGLDKADLDRLLILPLAGESAVMAVSGRAGALEPTPLWKAFEAKIASLEPALVILDTSADFFGGNEISRSEVRQFLGMLRGLALKHDCAVVLLSHPSVAGMSSGTGLSGSTAWGNSVRSRLYLTRPDTKDGEFVDTDIRVLSTMKANYGRAGGEIRLRWLDGRFVNETPGAPSAFNKIATEAHADRIFLDLLRQFASEGRDVSANRSPTYAPAQFAVRPHGSGLSKRALDAAMNRLLSSKRVRIETFGPPSKPRSRLVFVSSENGE